VRGLVAQPLTAWARQANRQCGRRRHGVRAKWYAARQWPGNGLAMGAAWPTGLKTNVKAQLTPGVKNRQLRAAAPSSIVQLFRSRVGRIDLTPFTPPEERFTHSNEEHS
jgi:hypothetical protein